MRRIHRTLFVLSLLIAGCGGSDPELGGITGPGSSNGDPPDLPAYSSTYSIDKGCSDYAGFNLGIGCADGRTLLGESATEAGSVREYPFESWSVATSPTEVREPGDVLDYLNIANSAYGVSLIPGPVTVAFLDSLSWGDCLISFVFGYVGAGPYKFVKDVPPLTPEAAALLPNIEIPGVMKRTHFYSTFADDPLFEVDDTAKLASFVRGHCDGAGSMREDAYALIGYSTRKYEELP
jgi:hypothetical protein